MKGKGFERKEVNILNLKNSSLKWMFEQAACYKRDKGEKQGRKWTGANNRKYEHFCWKNVSKIKERERNNVSSWWHSNEPGISILHFSSTSWCRTAVGTFNLESKSWMLKKILINCQVQLGKLVISGAEKTVSLHFRGGFEEGNPNKKMFSFRTISQFPNLGIPSFRVRLQ